MNRLFVAAILTLSLAAFAVPAQEKPVAAAAPQAQAEAARPELAQLRDQIRVFESALNQSLSQSFGGPFGYLDIAHGAYLPGYGVVFTFEINLMPMNMGPFEGRPSPAQQKIQREQARQKHDQARLLATRVLGDFGPSLSRVAPQESVAVVIHAAAARADGVERSTMVISAQKRDIDEFRSHPAERDAFVHKLQVLEY